MSLQAWGSTMRCYLGICGLAIALMSAVPAHALDPHLKISQYGHTAWRIKDGVFEGAPQVVTQSADGYLWIGTASNLVRFDGERFVPLIGRDEAPLRSNSIISLFAAPDGTLWVGSESAFGHRVDGKFTLMAPHRANQIVGRDGKIWYVRTRISDGGGPLCRVDGADVHCLGKNDGLPLTAADQLQVDADGGFWMGSSALVHWKDGAATVHFEGEFEKYRNIWGLGGIALGKDRSVWVSVPSQKPELALRHLTDGKWRDVTLPQPLPTTDQAQLFVDRENTLWIGTADRGVFRLVGDRLDHFASVDGLSGDYVQSFFEDSEGNLWVCTTRGLDVFRSLSVVDFTQREGLSADEAKSLLATDDGKLWIGNGAHLDWMSTTPPFATGHVAPPPQSRQVTSLARAKADALWVGVDDELLLHDAGRFQVVKRPDGASIGLTQMLADDASGGAVAAVERPHTLVHVGADRQVSAREDPDNVRAILMQDDVTWLATSDGRIIRERGGERTTFGPGARPLRITSMTSDPQRGLWLQTMEGLGYFADGEIRLLGTANGLPCTDVFALLIDDRSDFWLSMQCGYVHIARDDVKRWLADSAVVVPVRLFAAADGASAAYSDFAPRAARSSDGRLWFANGSTVQMIDPATIKPDDAPLPIHIEALHADRVAHASAPMLQLPPRTREVQFDWSAPTFAAPHNVAFRYRLGGYENNWQDAGERRQAFYNDLAPGQYRFEVTADRGARRWNGPVDTVTIDIAPAWFQTLWFRLAAACALLALAVLAYRWRMRRVSELARAHLKERIDERDRIARELHDTLLQSVQGLILHVHGAARRLPADAQVRRQLESTLQQAEATLSEGRDRVHAIRSRHGPATSLAHAFETVCAELAQIYPAAFDVRVSGAPRPLLTIVQDEAFWIAREALVNACRHAGASRIDVEIAYSRRSLQLRVVDDGSGIAGDAPTEEGHYGIMGMRERAQKIGARLAITPAQPRGTEIRLLVAAAVAYDTTM
jgi:signal transduction histidine kinase